MKTITKPQGLASEYLKSLHKLGISYTILTIYFIFYFSNTTASDSAPKIESAFEIAFTNGGGPQT